MANASQTGYKDKLRPIIVKMAPWGDSIDILPKGKSQPLREMGIAVATDLTGVMSRRATKLEIFVHIT